MEDSMKKDSKFSGAEESELEAPDGGWGWMVAIGYTIVWVTTLYPFLSFTFVFGDFLKDTGQEGSITTILTSLMGISFSVSSFATSPMLKNYSMRSVGIFGGFLFAVPNIMMAFVRRPMEMAVTYVIQGIGLGIIMMILSINFNAYFVKKRSMVMSISQVFIGLGGILYPIGVERLMEKYGYRGTAALLGAINLHCIFAMTLMRPAPGWNSKKPKLDSSDETKEPLVPLSLTKTKMLEKWDSRRSLQVNFSNSEVTQVDEVAKNRWCSLTSLRVQSGLGNQVLAASKDGFKRKSESSCFGTRCSRMLPSEYLDLMNDRSFMIMCLSVSFALMNDYTFSAFQPMMMESHGFTKSDVALSLTTSMAAELASRIGLAVFTTFVYEARPKHIFFVATVGLTIARLGYMYFEDTLYGTIVCVAIIGIVRSWMFVPQSLVVVEDLRVDQFAPAYGIFAIVSGTSSVIFGPLAGFVKDWTGSFVICQTVLLLMNILFIIPWGIELIFDRRRHAAEQVTNHSQN